jgi:hypothetical protein
MRRPLLRCERLEDRTLLNDTPLASATLLSFSAANTAHVNGSLTGTDSVALYRLNVTGPARLQVQLHGTVPNTRLALLDQTGRPLLVTDGLALGSLDDHIDQHLDGALGGTSFFLRIEDLGGGLDAYDLTAMLQSALPPFQPLPAGKGPAAIVTADFNGDGIPDLATANGGTSYGTFSAPSNDVTVFLGRGDGTFVAEPPIPVGTYPRALVTADFNGDGKPDLAVADSRSGDVMLLLGKGDGTFAAPQRIANVTDPTALVAADFNGDGRPDLAVLGLGTLTVLLQQPDGTFAATPISVPGRVAATSLAAADLNGDHKIDLVLPVVSLGSYGGSISSGIEVLRGQGDGTFLPQAPVPLTFPPLYGFAGIPLAIADFNGDGRPDLATLTSSGGSEFVTELLNRGDGTFAPGAQVAAGTNVTSLVATDFNGDGRTDLVALNSYPVSASSVTLLLNQGNATLVNKSSFALGGSLSGVAVADFNGDGVPDLAIASPDLSSVTILPGRPDGTFQTPQVFPAGINPTSVVTGDFNGDGIPDVATAGENGVTVLLGRGDGTLARGETVPVASAQLLAAGDFNGDGRLDLVALSSNGDAGEATVLLGRGDGTFVPQTPIPEPGRLTSVVVGDFNGDGIPDLAVAYSNYAMHRNGLIVLLGRGDGTFRALPAVPIPYGSALVVADFNGDGIPDLALAGRYSPPGLTILEGRGDGTFVSKPMIPLQESVFSVVAGDFNGDGKADLALDYYGPSGSSRHVKVLLGRGDGTFTPGPPVTVGEAGALVAADFNGDGRLDLAVVNTNYSSTGAVTVLLGRGDGTLVSHGTFPVGNNPTGLVVADFNGDGRPDLAVLNSGDSNLTVLLNLKDGGFAQGQSIPVGSLPNLLTSGDFHGDGIPDLVTLGGGISVAGYSAMGPGTVSLFRGLGNGRFLSDGSVPVPVSSGFLVTGDFNRDGHLDLAIASSFPSQLIVLLGRGDGSFEPPLVEPLTGTVSSLVAGDFNGDGILDLAIGSSSGSSGTVTILRGRGDGTFDAQPPISLGGNGFGPVLTTADFNGDGRPDLAAVTGSGSLTVLLQQPDGSFTTVSNPLVPVTTGPFSVVAADFNGDGKPDLAVTTIGFSSSPYAPSSTVTVLLGQGDGHFVPQTVLPVPNTGQLLVGDFNGDGKPDLALAGYSTKDHTQVLSLLLGEGNGDFPSSMTIPLAVNGSFFTGAPVIAADFNGDGRTDVAFTGPVAVSTGGGSRPSGVTVLLAQPDGTLGPPLSFTVGQLPQALVAGDFNGDGRPDFATTTASGDVAVLLRQPDGTLASVGSFGGGLGPALVTGDFNSDGRLDLATANAVSNDVTILFGQGNGRFEPEPTTFPVGTAPSALVAGDFNHDGHLDLAVADSGSNDVTVLLGRGDGTFVRGGTYPVGNDPQGLIVGDFNGDGKLDLAVADSGSNDVTVLLGRGDGTFVRGGTFPVGFDVRSLALGDFNNDGKLDLAASSPDSSTVAVLLGQGDGTFMAAPPLTPGFAPAALVAGDFNGDGKVDLAAASYNDDAVAVLLGQGDGTFVPGSQVQTGTGPRALAVGDFSGTGRLDLATANAGSNDVTTLTNLADGAFVDTTSVPPTPIRSTPLLADFNRDGVGDVVILNQAGQIFYRQGRPGAPGSFAPPVIVNPNRLDAVRAITVVPTAAGPILAAINKAGSALVFYSRTSSASFTRTQGPDLTGMFPTLLVAGDVNGDGRPDLLVGDPLSGTVSVFLANPDGSFRPGPLLVVGVGLSDLALAADSASNLPNLVVTNQLAGTVSILPNLGGGRFGPPSPYPADTGLAGLELRSGVPQRSSRAVTSSVAVADFNRDGRPDLVVANSGSNRVAVLDSTGSGFADPQVIATDSGPTVVRTGDFNGDGLQDVAILYPDRATLSIFLNDGRGGFIPGATINAGNQPNDFTLADVNGDGILDLVVGNAFGDVLVILGNGDGTFRPYQRAGQNIALAVADLKHDGHDDFIFADQSRDQVTVQYGTGTTNVFQTRQDGLLAPGAVVLADLNGDGIPDLIVANSGSNNVLVYLGLIGGQFGPEVNGGKGFFVGTNPVGITVADVNSDGIPDLVVANQGSNDVSVLLGQGQGPSWTLRPGPRLQAGLGPVATTVADLVGPNGQGGPDGKPDILVTNSGSNDAMLLPGKGQGFFVDTNALTRPTGADPRAGVMGNFDGSHPNALIVPNFGSNTLTIFPDFTSGASQTISSGGDGPVALLAREINGFLGLFVANNASSTVSLFLGGPGGLTLVETLPSPVRRPTALAESAILTDPLDVYVAGEGRDQAVLLPFVLPGGVQPLALAGQLPTLATVSPLGNTEEPVLPRPQTFELLPLNDMTLPVIPTAITGAGTGTPLAEEMPSGLVLLTTGLVAPGGGDDPAALEDEEPANEPPPTAALNRLLLEREPTPPGEPPAPQGGVQAPLDMAPVLADRLPGLKTTVQENAQALVEAGVKFGQQAAVLGTAALEALSRQQLWQVIQTLQEEFVPLANSRREAGGGQSEPAPPDLHIPEQSEKEAPPSDEPQAGTSALPAWADSHTLVPCLEALAVKEAEVAAGPLLDAVFASAPEEAGWSDWPITDLACAIREEVALPLAMLVPLFAPGFWGPVLPDFPENDRTLLSGLESSLRRARF